MSAVAGWKWCESWQFGIYVVQMAHSLHSNLDQSEAIGKCGRSEKALGWAQPIDRLVAKFVGRTTVSVTGRRAGRLHHKSFTEQNFF